MVPTNIIVLVISFKLFQLFISLDTYLTSIMANGKVSSNLARLWWFRFQEVGTLSEMVVVQLLLESLVRSFGEHRFFFKDGQDTHRLFSKQHLRVKNPNHGANF